MDDGIIDDRDAARNLQINANSIFIVYKYIKSNLKDLWNEARFSKRDII